MDREKLLERISINPEICFGKPCIRGHRIWVSLILDFLASGTSIDELLEDYPGLTREDIYACIAYGAEMTRERFVEVEIPGVHPGTERASAGSSSMNWEERISIDPEVLVGKPVIKGTRLAVEFIVELLAQGWSVEDILRSYPGISREDVQACLAYASAVLHSERVYPVNV